MKISHEFPLQSYKNNTAINNTDYDYCLAHHYLESEDYRNYMLECSRKDREIILDTSTFELGEAIGGEIYASIIEELNPTYYLLPDKCDDLYSNIETQISFYKEFGRSYNSKPMAVIHGKTSSELAESFKELFYELPSDTKFAIPAQSEAFKNEYRGYLDGRSYDPLLYSVDDIKYAPLRMALNRQKFIRLYKNLLETRKIHLLGCKSLAEFDIRVYDYKKSFIESIDTSLPVAAGIQGIDFSDFHTYNAVDDCICLENFIYKPFVLINEVFDDSYDESLAISNIKIFKAQINCWC